LRAVTGRVVSGASRRGWVIPAAVILAAVILAAVALPSVGLFRLPASRVVEVCVALVLRLGWPVVLTPAPLRQSAGGAVRLARVALRSVPGVAGPVISGLSVSGLSVRRPVVPLRLVPG